MGSGHSGDGGCEEKSNDFSLDFLTPMKSK